MKNTFGNSVSLTLFGESHGKEIGVVIDGLAPGIEVDEEYISHFLSLRRPSGTISTSRQESDEFNFCSGVFEGKTTGTPICITIKNSDTRSLDYEKTRSLARPGHADYTAFCKYHGYEDFRGGGHFSGRLTAPIVAAGAIFMKALEKKGIKIGTHVKMCGNVYDSPFSSDLSSDVDSLKDKYFATLSSDAEEKMKEAIEKARLDSDSVGGILETVITGVPAGVGEPWFDSVESVLSHLLFSVPGVKGVEFGAGFSFAKMRGYDANDRFTRNENGKIITATNNNGGINGGITNGMPIVFSCVIKPTPSIAKEQETVDFIKNESTTISIHGRHDPAIIHRARIVVDSLSAFAMCDMLSSRYGTDYLSENTK